MRSQNLLLAVLAFTSSITCAQNWPRPTTPMQTGIDKDTARHFGDAPADPGPLATDLSPALTPDAIDAATRKVADWQLRTSEPYFERVWTWSVLYSGFIAASESTGDPKYRDAMHRMSEHFRYELDGRTPNADTQSIAQTYLELYLTQSAKDKGFSPDMAQKMISPTRSDLDSIIALPTLKPDDPRIPWWWCDALFMAPPVWSRMYAATGDRKYIDYLDKQWAATYAALWDSGEHLYARDETFKPKRGPNGKKIFWSRGEGWVMGGLVRTLEYLPKDDPQRAFYEQNLRELAASLTKLLDPTTHLFHASLLDPEHFPLDETSGSALYLYGLTWGVNEGILDNKIYKPVIAQVWASLIKNHVYADGRFGGIQQTGAEPAFYPPSASFTYGVGGYLLAASELKRMALGRHAPPRLAQTLPSQTAHLSSAPPVHRFVAVGDHFELDGKPYQILSGEMHYSRIPREYWRERLQMARAMGLNTVATYVFWNVHEPTPDHFDFTGQNDLAAFLRMAQEEHLHVLLRAGPYSCAEWEFGGFPSWLLKDPRMSTALRSKDPAFMVPTERWIRRLAQEVASFQIDNGGPVLATQIENEYGNFSNDHAYMAQLRDIFVSAGFTQSLLYTVDPPKALANGLIPGVTAGVNFGTGHAKDGLDALARLRPGAPLFASEYWPGWFDLWGLPHQTRPIAPQVEDLNYILDHHGSVNIYMVHGGTSFGQMAGASESNGSYRGNVTSYDYDAPIDEAGHPTAKFNAYRDVITAHTHETSPPMPAVASAIATPTFTLKPLASLWDTLPVPVANKTPLTMEELGQSYGYVLYRKEFASGIEGELSLDHLYDFAVVYANGTQVGTLDRHLHQNSIQLHSQGPTRLDILVENTGRLNSTKFIRNERKGFRAATLKGEPVLDWKMYSLPMETAPDSQKSATATGPHFSSGTFQLSKVGDTYLDVRELGKGLIWINGHALGRFWNIGPQATLYVPAPWLRKGLNRVTIFELLSDSSSPRLKGLTVPILDGLTATYEHDPEHTQAKAKESEFGPKLATPADAPLKIVLVGDSTVATQGGWGPGFCAMMPAQVTCIDLARNGRSTKSYIDEGLWTQALAEHGDFYLIQFGHNDEKSQISLHTDPDTTFSENLLHFARDVRANGGIPILLSPLARRTFVDGKPSNPNLRRYGNASKGIAEKEHLPFLDLLTISEAKLAQGTQADADAYNAKGHADAKAENGIAQDRTHLNSMGQSVFGQMVARAFFALEPQVPAK